MTIQVIIKNTDTDKTRAVKVESSSTDGMGITVMRRLATVKAGEEVTATLHDMQNLLLSEVKITS